MDSEFLYLIGNKSNINRTVEKEFELAILTEKEIIGD